MRINNFQLYLIVNFHLFDENLVKSTTGGLDLFATFDPKKCGKKIQHVAKRSNTWQKDPMPGKKSFVSIKQTGFETNVIE